MLQHQEFQGLGTGRNPPNCLLDGTIRHTKSIAIHPGQQFTLDEQCIFFHGNCWKHELKDGQTEAVSLSRVVIILKKMMLSFSLMLQMSIFIEEKTINPI